MRYRISIIILLLIFILLYFMFTIFYFKNIYYLNSLILLQNKISIADLTQTFVLYIDSSKFTITIFFLYSKKNEE